MTASKKMTRQEFASVAAKIAELASKLSVDVISDLREGRMEAPIEEDIASEFVTEIREYLTWIEGADDA